MLANQGKFPRTFTDVISQIINNHAHFAIYSEFCDLFRIADLYPFHGDNTGSNPVGDAKKINNLQNQSLLKIENVELRVE